MNARWAVLLYFATAAVARAEAPECKARGWVVESASDHLVIESQKERMWFTLPKGDAGKKPQVRVGERVTVTFTSPLKTAAQATEIEGEASKQAPGEAPEGGPTHKGVIDDRAYYPA